MSLSALLGLGTRLYNSSDAHTGAWGTKDFGATELVGKLIGAPTTDQGGSNLSSKLGNAQSPIGPTKPAGQVLGDQSPNNYNQPKLFNSGATSGFGSLLSTANPTNDQNQSNPFNDAGQAAQSGTNAELQSLNTQFDRLRSQAESQIPFLQNERSRSLSNLANELTGLKDTVGSQKEESQQNTENQIDDAGQVARQTQRSNRNTLRALGILNSTAAGELLSKPLNEFDKIRSGIVQEGTRRINELDNFLNQKTAEHSSLVAQIEDNYSQLIGQIQNDLRFNERERSDAIRSANAALEQRLSEIQQAQFNWKTQIDTMKMQLAGELGQLQNYSQPQADLGILEGMQPQLEQSVTPQTASIYEKDKKQTGLSGLLN